MRKKDPEHIREILKKILRKMEGEQEERLEFSKVFEDLSLVLGKNISSHVKPYKLYRKKLFVLVNASVYLQELLFKKERIIDAVNHTFGKEIIRDVKFRVGEHH